MGQANSETAAALIRASAASSTQHAYQRGRAARAMNADERVKRGARAAIKSGNNNVMAIGRYKRLPANPCG
jgi:hypothetical protein